MALEVHLRVSTVHTFADPHPQNLEAWGPPQLEELLESSRVFSEQLSEFRNQFSEDEARRNPEAAKIH